MKSISLPRPVPGMLARITSLALIAALPLQTHASSHMDAPMITLDPAANTTDVYAFVSERDGVKYLTTALAVYPHEEPGVGPNKYNFDDNVRYEIHVATGSDVAAGRATYTYQFDFDTAYKSKQTILQSYLGIIENVGDAGQNLTQSYTVKLINGKKNKATTLGAGIVPPNNQGVATPYYNVGDNGDNLARDGVATAANLDRYTAQSVYSLDGGHRVFAGQREDGFYGDINSIFDLLQLRVLSTNPAIKNTPNDSQSGFNVHTIVLEIPLSELGGDQQVAGVYATTSRTRVNVLPHGKEQKDSKRQDFVQVGRQGNPLFCEALVAIVDKDLYNRTSPTEDAKLFAKYASTPELGALINQLIFGNAGGFPTTERSDLVGIFIPDLIKVDLSTAPARLAGGGLAHPTTPDDAGFSRLGIFGGDTLTSQIQAGFGGGTVPGGWPNGRRFGDDVVDIAVTALVNDLRPATFSLTTITDGIDSVSKNDAVYNKVFPYAGTPFNGRNHKH
ncbi:MAG: DUF4331 domain-containing protein [Opitutaceae bacterium]